MNRVQELHANHEASLQVFLDSVPDLDRTFFKEDIADKTLIKRWLGDVDHFRFVALENADVVGYLAVYPGVGRLRHVAELRLIVAAGNRRQGVGTALARTGLTTAVERAAAHKVVVEVPEPLNAAKAMFELLGFEPEALLRDHLEDANGDRHDLWLMSHFVYDNIDSLAALGVASDLSGDQP
jgi:ribosomal protein S18 acetylase RimI-like enzyme